MTKIELPPAKKVGHLTLLREPRAISAREFNALSFDERLEMVRVARGRQKYNLILEAADAERLVRSLPAQEIYLLLKELGAEDVQELLSLVTTDQFTTFLDLDCWQGDVLDGPSVLGWLQLLLEGEEEKVLSTVQEFDFELLVLMMKKLVTVTRGPEAFDDEEARLEALRRTGGYELEFRDSESAKVVGGLLETLLRRERDFYLRLLEAVRWETDAQLEEEVFHYRRGRLQDRGFPDPFEALGIYAYLEPDSFDPGRYGKEALLSGEEGVEAPGFVLTAASPNNLLAEVLAGGVASEACWELTFLLNKVMSADRVDVGDIDLVREKTEEVYRFLNIALEHLAGTDVAEAARFFDGVYLEFLFRLGFSLTMKLQQRTAGVKNSPIGPYLDGPFRALVDALGRKKPRFFEGIEDESRGGERPFASLRDIRLAGDWLDRLELQRRLFEKHFPFELPEPRDLQLEGCVPDAAEDLVLSDFFLTALANRVLGREFSPEPIPQQELPALHARICEGGKVAGALREETLQWLESLEAGAGAFGAYCLELWEGELCTMEAARLDPRYIGGLLVRLG